MATIKDLIKANLVSNGTELIWKRRQAKLIHTALINANGAIITSDGAIHKTPSGAAKHLNSNKPVDGWNTWKVKSTGKALSELRKNLIS